MAVLLPSLAYIKVLGTGEAATAGTIDVAAHTEILYARILLFKHGTLAGTEQVRMRLYSQNDNVIYTSAWSDVADITGLGTYWWGWFRLDFAREHINKDATYRAVIETQNYTDSDSAYLAVSLDWPVPQNTPANTPYRPLAFQLYGYRST